ncbi:MAG: asparagine synthetase [Thermoproteota archaeon]|nr:MAG: asparagine synthetase [Candidatus Korarchaeota archaeon]
MKAKVHVTDVIERMRSDLLLPLIRIQTTMLKAIHDFMVSRGFLQLMPVITSKFTDPLAPDPGSGVVAIPKIRYYDQELVLTQSMLLHKQLALLTGADKIYIMSPNVRLENEKKRSTGKHLFEFTQMDFEVAYGTMKQIMSLVEDLVIETIKAVRAERKEDLESFGRELRIPEKPFKVYTTHEMEERYGKEWELPASREHDDPFWVIDHDREFYDREDPERPGHFRNYDLIYPEGFGEGLSGGEREWEYDRILRRIKEDGLSPESYRDFLEIAKRGLLKPSAGAGLGVERFLRFLVGAKHIKDVQVFPRVPGEDVLI